MDPFNILRHKYSNGYKPKELGLDEFSECKMIFLDECIGKIEKDPLHTTPVGFSSFQFGPIAHAHLCKLEKHYKSICIPNKALRDKYGNVSDITTHEYGHIITEFPKEATYKHVGAQHAFSVGSLKISGDMEWNRYAHGPIFYEAMTKLGRPDLAKEYIEGSYILENWDWD